MPDRRIDVWTKLPPTERGLYWWRESIGYNAKIVWASSDGKALQVFSFATSPTKTLGGEWFGPLVEPGGDAIENCPEGLG